MVKIKLKLHYTSVSQSTDGYPRRRHHRAATSHPRSLVTLLPRFAGHGSAHFFQTLRNAFLEAQTTHPKCHRAHLLKLQACSLQYRGTSHVPSLLSVAQANEGRKRTAVIGSFAAQPRPQTSMRTAFARLVLTANVTGNRSLDPFDAPQLSSEEHRLEV